MESITANDLKTKGVSALESGLENQPEVIITVRGKERYVVMEMEHYHYLRECELDAALQQARKDHESGKTVVESVEDHVKRVTQ